MAFDTSGNRNSIVKIFPTLATDPHFHLTSEETVRYNCIAFAMGFMDRWVQPEPSGYIRSRFCWWPDSARKDLSEVALREAFEAVGFIVVADCSFKEGYDTVVLYSLNGQWTHAVRIIENGKEHSKFGESFDGTHGHRRFEGTSYGKPFAFMQRIHRSSDELLHDFPLPLGGARASLSLLRGMIS